MKKTLHIIPHSHWDREWYLPFEKHRVRLVELFDALIDTMERIRTIPTTIWTASISSSTITWRSSPICGIGS